jgi:signal transduction histidine kinase/ActR/RegA family two-component response regulator
MATGGNDGGKSGRSVEVQPDDQTRDDVAQLNRKIDELTVKLERHLLAEQTARLAVERANVRLAQLQALASALARSPRLADVVQAVLGYAPSALGASSAVIYLHTADRDTLELVGEVGYPAGLLENFQFIRTEDDYLMTVQAAKNGRPEWADSPEEGLQFLPIGVPPTLETGIHALASLPLQVDGLSLGAMTFGFDARRRLSDEERSFALTVADQCAQALARARLNDAAEVARADAEAANRAKDDFLATLSHELRTPLTAILGWANILRTRSPEPPALERGLATIERNARTLVQLIEDILDVSRIVSGKLRLEVRAVDPAAIVRAAIDVVRPAAETRSVTLDAAIDDDVGMVAADPGRLQQIAWNLLSNAIKFTPRGGRVEVLLDRGDAGVRLRVIDTGAGITAAFLPHIFERFRQADSSHTRGHGGLGLGLAIVKHLVELQQGTIIAESEGRGRGAKFTVTLPACAPDTSELSGSLITDPVTPMTARLEGVRVLIIDDDPDARARIAAILEEYGASVTAVASAHKAIDALDLELPDVLVADIGMPDEDGYVLLEKVRARDASARERQIPALALTAYAGAHDVRTAERAGFQLHLAKPLVPGLLIDAVARLVAARPPTPLPPTPGARGSPPTPE